MRRWVEPLPSEVRVGGLGVMYAGCSVYACNDRNGAVIDLGGNEIRLCREHARDLIRQLRERGIR